MISRILLVLCACILAVHGQFHHYEHESQPLPYNFGYAVQDLHGGHFRKEAGDGHGAVKGSYGFTDPNGFRREVHYVADHNGFRAQVKTNEPGTISGNPADVHLYSSGAHTDGYQQFRSKF